MKIKYISLLFIAASLFVSCNDDDLDGLEPSSKPMATTSVTSLSLLEGETGVIPFTINNPINKVSAFKIEILDDDGMEQEVDYFIGDQPMDADTGIPHVGFEQTVPAYATSFDIPFESIRNLDQTEGTRTVRIRISAAGVRTILTPEPYVINVTITDFEYCAWTFEMTDLYGDGWNGGFLEVNTDSGSAEYYAMDEDGLVGVAETTTVTVPIPLGDNYTITYVSGGGTGAGPGWESENVYTLTAPDGTVFSDGPIPTAGVVTSGTCN